MFDISALRGLLNKKGGPARENTYIVMIQPPAGFAGMDSLELSFLCDSAELPGRQLMTTPQVIYGAQRKMPYGPMYTDFSCTFICTNDMTERKIFESWQSLVQDPTNNYMNYYDKYVGRITIIKYNDQAVPVHWVVCEEAYPIFIEPQQLNWQQSGDRPLGLRVNFAYLKWRSMEDVIRAGGSGGGYTPDLNAIPPIFSGDSDLASSPVEFPARDVPQITRPSNPGNKDFDVE